MVLDTLSQAKLDAEKDTAELETGDDLGLKAIWDGINESEKFVD